MLKARSRKLSLVLVLAMLMTMFAGLGVANAATGYSASDVPLVDEGALDVRLGSVIVTFDNYTDDLNQFILKLPSDFVFTDITPSVTKEDDAGNLQVLATIDGNQAMISVYTADGTSEDEIKFSLALHADIPDSAPEVINATIIAQPGSVFADGIVQVAKTGSSSVTALAGDAVTVTGAGTDVADDGDNVVIYFRENKPGALDSGSNSFTLKLPKGFEWVEPGLGDLHTLTSGYSGATEFNISEVNKIDDRTLRFDRDVVDDEPHIWKFSGDIIVDEAVAAFGDITVTIGGSSNISPASVIVGKYADYGVEVVVDDPETEVIAGRHEQYVSDFAFEESINDSLLDGRTIYVELPSGVKWDGDSDDADGWLDTDLNGTAISVIDSNQTLKIVIGDNVGESEENIEISDALVEIAGTYSGDIKAKIWGNAGISEEIVLAKAIAPISVTADMKDVKIGLQKQAGGNIVITEAKAEAITTDSVWLDWEADEDNDFEADTEVTVALPFNVTWGDIPTVKVIEGDIELGTVSTNGSVLTIPIDSSSSVASKIEISDVTYTVDRTVPEGDMKAEFAGGALVQTTFTNKNYIVKEVVANCVTPAPSETIGSGEFKIGSNIYYAGGVAKVMDVAPYIKNGRTYVPMRYLGEILGAEVVWDAAAKTVTMTKGDVTVVFTVGSTSYTVNGEAKTADVAPEIVSDRTMLPARYVAEAFGAVVGWDAATQTVLISK